MSNSVSTNTYRSPVRIGGAGNDSSNVSNNNNLGRKIEVIKVRDGIHKIGRVANIALDFLCFTFFGAVVSMFIKFKLKEHYKKLNLENRKNADISRINLNVEEKKLVNKVANLIHQSNKSSGYSSSKSKVRKNAVNLIKIRKLLMSKLQEAPENKYTLYRVKKSKDGSTPIDYTINVHDGKTFISLRSKRFKNSVKKFGWRL